jgi:hypothetical protein
VKANARTGLSSPDVYYFGNLVGDTGTTPLRVDSTDYFRTREAIGTGAADKTSPYDFDRDGEVTASDVILARRNLGVSLSAVQAPAAIAPTTARNPLRRRSAYDTLVRD